MCVYMHDLSITGRELTLNQCSMKEQLMRVSFKCVNKVYFYSICLQPSALKLLFLFIYFYCTRQFYNEGHKGMHHLRKRNKVKINKGKSKCVLSCEASTKFRRRNLKVAVYFEQTRNAATPGSRLSRGLGGP